MTPKEGSDDTTGAARARSADAPAPGSGLSNLTAELQRLTAESNHLQEQYAKVVNSIGPAHAAGDLDKVARAEASARHVQFLIQTTLTRTSVVTTSLLAFLSQRQQAEAGKHTHQMVRATWVLAGATIGLVIATIVLVVVTLL